MRERDNHDATELGQHSRSNRGAKLHSVCVRNDLTYAGDLA